MDFKRKTTYATLRWTNSRFTDDLASLHIALLRAKTSRLQQAHPNDLRGTKNLQMRLLLF